MVQYQQVRKDDGVTNPNVILRVDDISYIPNDSSNLDYQEYLAWVGAGNTPLPPAAVIFNQVEIDLQNTARNEQAPLHSRVDALVKLLTI
jgi:hypothetical protein